MSKSCSITPIAWWNPDSSSWESSVPYVLLDPGGNAKYIGARVRLTNTGSETFNMQARFRHYAPGGMFLVEQGAGNDAWPPGDVLDCDCVYGGGWFEGTWYQAAEVKDAATGAIIATASFNEAYMVSQLPYAGKIENVYWRPAGGSWSIADPQQPASLAQGTEIELAADLRNTGTQNLPWQLELVVVSPSGGSRPFTYNKALIPPNAYPLWPGFYWQLTFNERLLLDEVGIYSAHLTLSKEGTA